MTDNAPEEARASGGSAPDITIAIYSRDGADRLSTCLESLYRHAPPRLALETIVVVEHRDRGSQAVARRFPGVAIVEIEPRAGFSAAHNRAFRLARGRFILMLSPAATFCENALQRLHERMEADPRVDLIAPMLLGADGGLRRSARRFPTVWSVFCEATRLHGCSRRTRYAEKTLNEAFLAESCWGAALLFRSEVLGMIGFLDEAMPRIEDLDFCRRAYDAGLKLLYFPLARLTHHDSRGEEAGERGPVSGRVFDQIEYFRKHRPGLAAFLVACMSLYRAAIELLVLDLRSPRNAAG